MKTGYVLDSSALLAWMFNEPGKEAVSKALKKGCLMNTVNWSEVVQKANERGIETQLLYERLREKQVLNVVLHMVEHTEALAVKAGELLPTTKQFGLSLGDRSCLALAHHKNLAVVTADTVWKELEEMLNLDIQVIR